MKDMKKRPLCALLALVLILALAPAAMAVSYGAENPPERFSDVKSDNWAYEYIEEMAKRGAINGYPDGTFKPKDQVTRVEFAKILVVAGGLVVPDDARSSFADVRDGNWGVPYIEVSKPYMTYYKSGGQLMFKPKEAAVREDIAVAVVKLKGYDTRSADLAMLEAMFSDVDTISEAAKPYVALAVENKLISGYTDGTFRGQKTITRAETAAILWRAFQYGSDDKVVDPTESGKPVESAQPTAPVEPEKPGESQEPAQPEKKQVDMIDKCACKSRNYATVIQSKEKKKIRLGDEVIDHWIRLSKSNWYYTKFSTPNSVVYSLSGEFNTLTLRTYASYDSIVTIYNNETQDSVLGTFNVKGGAEPSDHTISINGAVVIWISAVYDQYADGNPTENDYVYIYNAYLE